MRRPGQALVEFALVISVFMLLVLGTFDLARAYLAYTVVTNAAREASRYGAVHVGEACWDTNAAQAGSNLAVGLDSTAVKLTVVATGITPLPAPCAPPMCVPAQPPATLPYITVCGTYQFQIITPLVGAALGKPNGIPIRVDTSTLAG